ncbi:hypothetical protein [Streptomyces mirabilis]|uniref:hypothetical protein n=1 Tax=Streptomyces mirabilis TaxID=68239 RepID=UPI0033FC3CA4
MTTHTHAPAAEPETVPIPLPGIKVRRPAHRGDGWRVIMGRVEGRGSTFAAAKANLAAQITTTVETLEAPPAFARDDDGALVVAIDRPWGIDTFRATATTARLVSSGNRHPKGPAADLDRVHHFTLLPAYTSGLTAGAPRPHVFTLAEIDQALAFAQERSREWTKETHTLELFAGAVRAWLNNPQTDYPYDHRASAPENDVPAPAPTAGSTVTVRAVSNGYVSEFSTLPGKTFGPWGMAEVIQDLTVSALLSRVDARSLVMDAAANGTATTNTKG